MSFFTVRTCFVAALVVAFISAACLCSDLISLAYQYGTGKRAAQITVFIHGSVYTQLWPLDVKGVFSDQFSDDSPYVDLVQRIRKNPLLWQDQIMLQEGWAEIPFSAIKGFCDDCVSVENRQKAAYLFVPAYDMIAQATHRNHVEDAYFLFGHLGLLSREYRRQVAEELYQSLSDTVAQFLKKYWSVTVTLVVHSHGGGIALNLARAEQKYKRGLVVDNLIMFGTPIQEVTAFQIHDPLFKRVINCYSDGDWVQGLDRMSVDMGYSYKKLYDEKLSIERPDEATSQIYDVRWLVNNNPNTVGHGNMWLMGREGRVTKALDPLPAVIFTPVLVDLLDQYPYDGSFDFNIIDKKTALYATLTHTRKKEVLATSHDYLTMSKQIQKLVHTNWDSFDKSRMLLLNYQTGAVLWQALKDWRNGGRKK